MRSDQGWIKGTEILIDNTHRRNHMRQYIGMSGMILALLAPASGAQGVDPNAAHMKALSVLVRDKLNLPIADVSVQMLGVWG